MISRRSPCFVATYFFSVRRWRSGEVHKEYNEKHNDDLGMSLRFVSPLISLPSTELAWKYARLSIPAFSQAFAIDS